MILLNLLDLGSDLKLNFFEKHKLKMGIYMMGHESPMHYKQGRKFFDPIFKTSYAKPNYAKVFISQL